MSLDRTVAWVITQSKAHIFSDCSDVLADSGIQMRRFGHAAPAITELTRTRYGCIVTDLDIAPGQDHGDPEMERIMRRPDLRVGGSFIGYPHIALYMIRRLREPASANRETPIIVASVYHPSESRRLPGAKDACEVAGATAYLRLQDVLSPDFLGTIEHSLR